MRLAHCGHFHHTPALGGLTGPITPGGWDFGPGQDRGSVTRRLVPPGAEDQEQGRADLCHSAGWRVHEAGRVGQAGRPAGGEGGRAGEPAAAFRRLGQIVVITWRLMTPRRCVRPSWASVRSLRDSGKHAMTAVRANRHPFRRTQGHQPGWSVQVRRAQTMSHHRCARLAWRTWYRRVQRGVCIGCPWRWLRCTAGSGPRLGRPGGSMIGQAAGISQEGRLLWFPFTWARLSPGWLGVAPLPPAPGRLLRRRSVRASASAMP